MIINHRGICKYAQLFEDRMVQRFLCFFTGKRMVRQLKLAPLFLSTLRGKTGNRHISQGRSSMSLRFFINTSAKGSVCPLFIALFNSNQRQESIPLCSESLLFHCLPVWLAGQGRSSSSHEYSGLQITRPQRNVIVLLTGGGRWGGGQ